MLNDPGLPLHNVWHSQGPADMPCNPHPLHGEDNWEDSLLESAGDEPVASLTPAEEALLLGENPEPQGVQGICPTYSLPVRRGSIAA